VYKRPSILNFDFMRRTTVRYGMPTNLDGSKRLQHGSSVTKAVMILAFVGLKRSGVPGRLK
jgi:hypothetical protein